MLIYKTRGPLATIEKHRLPRTNIEYPGIIWNWHAFQLYLQIFWWEKISKASPSLFWGVLADPLICFLPRLIKIVLAQWFYRRWKNIKNVNDIDQECLVSARLVEAENLDIRLQIFSLNESRWDLKLNTIHKCFLPI